MIIYSKFLIDFAYYYIKSLHLSKQVILWIYFNLHDYDRKRLL